MWFFGKILALVVTLGGAVQLGSIYFETIIIGGYFHNASLGSGIIVGLGGPIALAMGAFFLVRAIIRFEPKSLKDH